jgi:hypothetical protein
MNVVSSDVDQFQAAAMNMHYVVLGPLQLTAIAYLTWMVRALTHTHRHTRTIAHLLTSSLQEIGPSALAGLSLFVLLIPLHFFSAALYVSLQLVSLHFFSCSSFFLCSLQCPFMLAQKKSALKDSRLKTMGDLLLGMRVFKMYAWEKVCVCACV